MKRLILCVATVSVFALVTPVTAQVKDTTATQPDPTMGQIQHNRVGGLTPAKIEMHRKESEAIAQGEALVKAGNFTEAVAAFQEAVAYYPNDGLAMQRLAEAYAAQGDLTSALSEYQTLFNPPPGIGNSQLADPAVLMGYAIVLLHTGHTDDAIAFYNKGVGFCNYEDGEQNTPVLFPTFGSADSQAQYTPQLLEALADACICACQIIYYDAATSYASYAQQAMLLAPNNPLVLFYAAQCLQDANTGADGKPLPSATRAQNRAVARAAYRKAAALGGGIFTAAIKKNRGEWAFAQPVQTQPVQTTTQAK